MPGGSSKDSAKAEHAMRCAACRKSGEGLMTCTACLSVLYCNVDCQRVHRNAHEKECKEREAELHSAASAAYTEFTDDELFADPPQRELCPICSIRLPFIPEKASYHSCCGKVVCNGCLYECKRVLEETNASRRLANLTRDADSQLPLLKQCCAFCRAQYNVDGAKETTLDRLRQRMEANDAHAFFNVASSYRNGIHGFPVDHHKAFELMSRAANLGLAEGCYSLGFYYRDGIGVERNNAKENYYFKMAAMKGSVDARFNLGCVEAQRGNNVLATKHWLISAAAGDVESMKQISDAFRRGVGKKDVLTKEIYEKTLRAHQHANEEVKSDARYAVRRFKARSQGARK